MSFFGHYIKNPRALVIAIGGAVVLVAQDPHSVQNWAAAITGLAAAFSGGSKKDEPQA